MKNSIRLPKNKSGLKSFNKIIEVSKELIANKGYQATSINEIIREASIATGTFYKYFDDKRAVYDYLLNDYSIKIRKRISDAIKDSKTRYDKEKIGLRAFIKFALEDKLSYRLIWESLFVDRDLFVNYYKNFSKSYIKQLEQAVKSNEIDPNIDLETLSFVLMGISNFVGLQVAFKDNVTEDDLDNITDQAMYILKNGMFTK